MDAKTLAACTGSSLTLAEKFADVLSAAMAFYSIDTVERQAMFLSNVGHESGRLVYTTELWGPTASQKGYEGRKDLGNIYAGDGSRYRGRGLLQTTGRANYAAVTKRLQERFNNVPDFEKEPTLLAEPQWAAFSAGDYADMKNLNSIADSGKFERYVRVINGGTNGLSDRMALYASAKKALA